MPNAAALLNVGHKLKRTRVPRIAARLPLDPTLVLFTLVLRVLLLVMM